MKRSERKALKRQPALFDPTTAAPSLLALIANSEPEQARSSATLLKQTPNFDTLLDSSGDSVAARHNSLLEDLRRLTYGAGLQAIAAQVRLEQLRTTTLKQRRHDVQLNYGPH